MDLSWEVFFSVFALLVIIAAGVTRFLVATNRGRRTEGFSPPSVLFSGEVPYRRDRKRMPTGNQTGVLLPARIGSFQRTPIRDGNGVIYAEYSDGRNEISMELGICDSPADAQDGVQTYKLESADVTVKVYASSVDSEPSFHLATYDNPRMGEMGRGIGMAWTRGRYYFSASAKSLELLDRFMEVFPF